MIELVFGSMAAFATALVSAVAGFGGGVLLLPVLTGLFGLREAVPLLTFAQVVSNGSRLTVNRKAVHWPLVKWYVVGSVPFAVLGGVVFAVAPLRGLQRIIGIFLLLLVIWRRVRATKQSRMDRRAFVAIGAGSGLISALIGVVGPITAPFFLSYGLVRAAFIGTEAACSFPTQLTKLATYGSADLISLHVVLLGLALTPATMLGVWAGKHLVDRLSERVFAVVVEVGLVVAAVFFLVKP